MARYNNFGPDNHNYNIHNNDDSVHDQSLSELPLDMKFNDGHRMAIVMYTVLMCVSAIGNIFVFCSIMRIRFQDGNVGRINLLLLNLAVADLVVTFVLMPVEIGWNATVSWHAGDLLCRILAFFRTFGLYLSGFVLICICLDRYFAIVSPLANLYADRRNKRQLVCAWTAGILFSIPQSFIFHVERHPEFPWYEQCVTFNSFPSREYELAYNLLGFSLMYAIPMATIIYCYSFILYKMYSVTGKNLNEQDLRRSTSAFIQRAKIKTLKMSIITALAFFICWTPYNVISLWYWFDKDSAVKLDQRLQKGLFVFACTNSCLNPVIYGWYRPKSSSSSTSGNRVVIRHSLSFISEEYKKHGPSNLAQVVRNTGKPISNENSSSSPPWPTRILKWPLHLQLSVPQQKSASYNFEGKISKYASVNLMRSLSCSIRNYHPDNGKGVSGCKRNRNTLAVENPIVRTGSFNGNVARVHLMARPEIKSISC